MRNVKYIAVLKKENQSLKNCIDLKDMKITLLEEDFKKELIITKKYGFTKGVKAVRFVIKTMINFLRHKRDHLAKVSGINLEESVYDNYSEDSELPLELIRVMAFIEILLFIKDNIDLDILHVAEEIDE